MDVGKREFLLVSFGTQYSMYNILASNNYSEIQIKKHHPNGKSRKDGAHIKSIPVLKND